MSNNREQQIRLHHEKWKRWKIQMKGQQYKQKKVAQKPLQSVHNYAAKIIGKLQQPQDNKNGCPISNKFERQFESNSCSSCLQLMIPPRNPMTLFPCGHNMCKICLYVNGHQKLKKYNLKTKRCSLCSQQIKNSAQNRSLMNLICTYTDNKHLIQKQEQVIQQDNNQSQNLQTIDRLKLRCQILQKQKRSVSALLAKQKKQKGILDEVMQKLVEQRNKNSKQIYALQEQSKLIQKFLSQKRQQLQKVKLKIVNAQQKKKVVQKALQPLKNQKQKLQVLEAAKMLS